MEQVILVDKNNKPIGTEEKIKTHQEGKLHRAFSIFIFNSSDQLLIQQRAKQKYHCGGIWSNTVCSHPRPEETYSQATHRRLKEEMGFDCQMEKLFCFTYRAQFENGLIENEYDCVFKGKFDGQPQPNPKEVMNYQWVSIPELEKDIVNHPDKYSIWLKIALNKMKFS